MAEDIITVSTRKGGVLKTSICVNLAGALAYNGKKVLIIDMDSQSNVILSFGRNPDQLNASLHDFLVKGYGLKFLNKSMIRVHENIDILPSNDDMLDFELDVIINKERYKKPFHLLKGIVDFVSNSYDYIIIDTPPNFGLVQGNALLASKSVIVPFQPEKYSMRALIKIIETIKGFKVEMNPGLRLACVVPTLVDMRTTLHSEVLKEVEKYCSEHDVHLTKTSIPKSIRYPSSITYENKPITLSDTKSTFSRFYFNLLDEIYCNGGKVMV